MFLRGDIGITCKMSISTKGCREQASKSEAKSRQADTSGLCRSTYPSGLRLDLHGIGSEKMTE